MKYLYVCMMKWIGNNFIYYPSVQNHVCQVRGSHVYVTEWIVAWTLREYVFQGNISILYVIHNAINSIYVQFTRKLLLLHQCDIIM